MTRILVAAAVLSVGLAAAPAAMAHALLRHAEPPVGSTIASAPTVVAIDFSEGVEPAFSSIEVLDATGHSVSKGKPHLAPGDAQRLVEDLEKLQPGTYRVVWHAVSVDTHRTEGDYRFTVAP